MLNIMLMKKCVCLILYQVGMISYYISKYKSGDENVKKLIDKDFH